jgi:DNA-binding transcriptional LysR family regulator
MDLDKLKVFYYVAKEKSVQNAAKHLHIAQSAVSRTIKTLEERLKTNLFIRRKSKGMELTEIGAILFEKAINIMRESNEAEEIVKDYKKEALGPLKVLSTSGTIYAWLINFVPGYLKAYPKIRLTLHGTTSLNLDTSEADVAIGPYIPNNNSLIQVHIRSQNLKLFASKDYLSKFGTPKKPADLDKHQLLAFNTLDKSPLGDVDYLLHMGTLKHKDKEPYLRVNSADALFKAAEAGLGVISLDASYPPLNGSNLVEILPELEGKEFKQYYIYRSYMKDSKRINSLCDYLLSKIKND